MPNAISNKEVVAYGAEVTWGTTPAIAGTVLRYNKIQAQHPMSTTNSAEIVNSSEVPGLIRTKARANLSIDTELSAGNLDAFLQSLFANTWATNVLQVGATRQPLTVERQLTDITQFLTYKGFLVNELDLTIGIGKIMTGTVKGVSKFPINASVTAFTGANVAAETNPIMDPISSIQLVQEGGSGSVTGVTAITLNIKRSVIDEEQIASIDPADLQPGLFTVTGDFTCYFPDATYLTKFLAFTSSTFQVKIGGVASHSYAFLLGALQYTDFSADNTGINNPITQKLPFTAFKSGTSTLQVTRVA